MLTQKDSELLNLHRLVFKGGVLLTDCEEGLFAEGGDGYWKRGGVGSDAVDHPVQPSEMVDLLRLALKSNALHSERIEAGKGNFAGEGEPLLKLAQHSSTADCHLLQLGSNVSTDGLSLAVGKQKVIGLLAGCVEDQMEARKGHLRGDGLVCFL